MERTLVLIKPEGIKRSIIGRILTRFEDAGLKIIGMKMVQTNKALAEKHYRQDIADKYGEKIRNLLLEHIRGGPVLAVVLEGVDGIKNTRKLIGESPYPNECSMGTIRGDFTHVSKDYANEKGISVKNLVHSSADAKDAKIELPLWFSEKELHSYKNIHDIICLE